MEITIAQYAASTHRKERGTMYRLVRRSDGAVLQICEGDFQEFLREKYGGYFAVKTKEGILSGAARYDAYWEEVEEGDGNDV